MPILRSRGSRRWNSSTISGRSFRVVGSPPEMFRFSTAPQNSWSHDAVELVERHVALAVAALPVVAHLAARIADEGAVVDEHRRADRLDLRHDERVRQIARHARGGAGQIVQAEGVNGHNGARPKSRVLRGGPFCVFVSIPPVVAGAGGRHPAAGCGLAQPAGLSGGEGRQRGPHNAVGGSEREHCQPEARPRAARRL